MTLTAVLKVLAISVTAFYERVPVVSLSQRISAYLTVVKIDILDKLQGLMSTAVVKRAKKTKKKERGGLTLGIFAASDLLYSRLE